MCVGECARTRQRDQPRRDDRLKTDRPLEDHRQEQEVQQIRLYKGCPEGKNQVVSDWYRSNQQCDQKNCQMSVKVAQK